jgi:hypothetical protein
MRRLEPTKGGNSKPAESTIGAFILVGALKPGAEQHQVDRTGRQQGGREHDAHAVGRRFRDRLHDRNIGRFHRPCLGLYFSPRGAGFMNYSRLGLSGETGVSGLTSPRKPHRRTKAAAF